MGRRLTRDLPPGASSFQDRHGKRRVRFRKVGRPDRYAQAAPGTDEFWREYLAWRDAVPAPDEPALRVAPGSMDEAVERFTRSPRFAAVPGEGTRTNYRQILDRFLAAGAEGQLPRYGARQLSGFTAARLGQVLITMMDRPAAANRLLNLLGLVFDHAILSGLRADNPARVVRPLPAKGEGFRAWEEADIARFRAHWASGTKPRLALELLLGTLQRRGDVVRLGRQHRRGDVHHVRQQKTGAVLDLPVTDDLAAELALIDHGHLTYLVTDHGAGYGAAGFGNRFREWCDAAGCQGLSAHGLRKAGTRRLAEAGATQQQIKSWTGHRTDSEVARYARSADQRRLAESALPLLNGEHLSNLLSNHS